MKTDPKILACPTCGSSKIKRVCADWNGSFEGEDYRVEKLEHYACPECGEKVYPPESMRRIQQASPAYASRRSHKTSGTAA